MKNSFLLFLTCALLSISAAAQSGNQVSQPDISSKNVPAATQSQPVPAVLMKTAALAEDIYDAANNEKWKDAAKKLPGLQTAAKGLSQAVPGQQALVDQIKTSAEQMGTTVPVSDQLRTMQNANIITRDVAKLSGNFHTTVPIEVSMLDYYGRELQIGTKTDNSSAMTESAKQLAQTWQKIRPAVVQHGGSQQASDWDELVQKIQAANSADDYDKLAEKELEQVDQLEQLFQHSPTAQK